MARVSWPSLRFSPILAQVHQFGALRVPGITDLPRASRVVPLSAANLPEARHGHDYAFDHVHDSTRDQRLLAHAGEAVDVRPFYLGRCAPAARPSGNGELFHQRPYSV